MWERADANSDAACKASPHHDYTWRGPISSFKDGWQNDLAESAVAAEPLVSTLGKNRILHRETEDIQSGSCSTTSRTPDPSHVPSLSFNFPTCKVEGLSMDDS